jgi:hypothetical protein
MKRYLLETQEPVLDWLMARDDEPTILPVFPESQDLALVVAHLLSGDVYAEVIPAADNVKSIVGGGIPLGRLYFQIPKKAIYNVCPNIAPDAFF